MLFDPQEMRHTLYSAPCAICRAAVGATGTFMIRKNDSGATCWFGPFCSTHRPPPLEAETIVSVAEQLDRTIDFLASPEGITAEEEIRPAVHRAVNEARDRRRKKKGGV